jgi:hypothetical protein
MRRIAYSMMIEPADIASGVNDSYSPFADDSRMWKLVEDVSDAKKKIPKHLNRMAAFFRSATEELKPLPAVDEYCDSHIIRAAHMVTAGASVCVSCAFFC